MTSKVAVFLALVLGLVSAAGPVWAGWTVSTEIATPGWYSTQDIAAAAGNNVWTIIGGSRRNQPVCFFNGSAWSVQTTAFTAETGEFRGIFAYDSSSVWVVGNATSPAAQGRVFSFNGSDWVCHSVPGTNYLYDAFATSASDVWLSANVGIRYSSDGGATWAIQTQTGISTSIHGINPSNIWAVAGSDPATILHYDGSSWSVQTRIGLGSGKYLRSVHAQAVDDVWTGGDTGVVLHYNGQWSVSTVIGDAATSISGISASGADSVWAAVVGSDYGIYRYNGSEWSLSTSQPSRGVDASSPGRVWACGISGKVYLFQPPTPSPAPTFATPTPTAAPSASPTASISPAPTAVPVNSAVVGDYNGDGTSDITLFRPSTGSWLIRGLTRVWFGSSTDQPVPQDYSGNGAWDIAIHRSSQAKWMVRGVSAAWFGVPVDVAIPADYDGDGSADLAVFRPTIGKWVVKNVTQAFYGVSSDSLVPGNYAGDPRAQIAVYRPATGRWMVRDLTTLYFGAPTDSAVPGPYSGGLTWDYAVFRHTQGKWMVRGLTNAYYGVSTDIVQPADYDGDGTWDFGVFRSSTGRWLIRLVTNAYYGVSTDRPVTNP